MSGTKLIYALTMQGLRLMAVPLLEEKSSHVFNSQQLFPTGRKLSKKKHQEHALRLPRVL